MKLHDIPLTAIIIPPDRIREDLGDIWALACSIRDRGLMQPIVVDSDMKLVAGYRRYIACQRLGLETIPAVAYGDLTPIQRLILELEENIRRKQLTWQEEAKAKSMLHRVLVEEHGPGVPGHKVGWALRDTSNLLGESLGKTAEDIQLAQYVDNAVVGARKSRVEAIRAMKRVRELEILCELASRMKVGEEAGGGGAALGQFSLGRVLLGDCRELLSSLPDQSVHLVLTDPPYGIDIDFSRWAKGHGPYPDLPQEENFRLVMAAATECFRVLADGGYIFIFCAVEFVREYVTGLMEAGFEVLPRPLIWCKGRGSLTDFQTQFAPAYETFLCGFKGTRRPFALPLADVFHYSRPTERWHRLERPVGLLADLVKTASSEGEVVLDPFCGGGSTLVAAMKSLRRFIGIEQDPPAWASACQRITLLEQGEDDDSDDQSPSGGAEDSEAGDSGASPSGGGDPPGDSVCR